MNLFSETIAFRSFPRLKLSHLILALVIWRADDEIVWFPRNYDLFVYWFMFYSLQVNRSVASTRPCT